MEEISLYRKYRPTNFDNLVGQDHVKNTLTNAFKTSRVAHAYLFTGPRGTGKTSTARLIAKALNCTNLHDGFEPCGECEFCKDISEGRLIDLIEIDAASNRGIDEVRDLKEKINFAPTRSKVKVYIIDEVHMMTKEAFNALLKTLEEPPAHAYFILATTEAHKIPETIISRCQRFDFKRIGQRTLMTRLSYIAQIEGIKAEDQALEAISKYVDGGLRDAIGLLEQLTVDGELNFERVQEILGISGLTLLEKMYEVLTAEQTKEALNIINELHGQGSDLRQFIHEFIDLLRNKMLEAVANDDTVKVAGLIKMIEIFQKAQQRLELNIPQLSLEIAVIELTNNFENVNIEATQKIPIKEAKADVLQTKERKHQTIVQKEEKIEIVELSMDSLTKIWPRIAERIKTPSLRLSLKNAIPVELDGLNVTLQFSTNFHKEKVMEHAHRVELESIIQEFFGKLVKISAIVKSIEIKPMIEEKADKGVVDEALEIFGGKLVDS